MPKFHNAAYVAVQLHVALTGYESASPQTKENKVREWCRESSEDFALKHQQEFYYDENNVGEKARLDAIVAKIMRDIGPLGQVA